MAPAFDLLQQLGEDLEDGDVLSPEVAEWLRSAMPAFAAGASMDDALGLTGAAQWRLEQRAAWLVEGALRCPGPRPWQRAQQLAARIAQFSSPRSKFLRESDRSPCDGVLSALWHARRFGELPSSTAQLYRVLNPHLHGDPSDASESEGACFNPQP